MNNEIHVIFSWFTWQMKNNCKRIRWSISQSIKFHQFDVFAAVYVLMSIFLIEYGDAHLFPMCKSSCTILKKNIIAATSHKTTAPRPLISHFRNNPIKIDMTCWGPQESKEELKSDILHGLLYMDTPVLAVK